MQEAIESKRYRISRLKYMTGIRLWVDDPESFPEPAAQLLQAANRVELTPAVMLFELGEEQWSISLLGNSKRPQCAALVAEGC